MYIQCHKNLGPLWKALCCMTMGVPVPLQALENILEDKRLWKKTRENSLQAKRIFTNGKVCMYLKKTLTMVVVKSILKCWFAYRNIQKRAKKARHEREKEFMEQLRGAGHVVGEYIM